MVLVVHYHEKHATTDFVMHVSITNKKTQAKERSFHVVKCTFAPSSECVPIEPGGSDLHLKVGPPICLFLILS